MKNQEELYKANTPRDNDMMTLGEWVRFAMEKVFKNMI